MVKCQQRKPYFLVSSVHVVVFGGELIFTTAAERRFEMPISDLRELANFASEDGQSKQPPATKPRILT